MTVLLIQKCNIISHRRCKRSCGKPKSVGRFLKQQVFVVKYLEGIDIPTPNQSAIYKETFSRTCQIPFIYLMPKTQNTLHKIGFLFGIHGPVISSVVIFSPLRSRKIRRFQKSAFQCFINHWKTDESAASNYVNAQSKPYYYTVYSSCCTMQKLPSNRHSRSGEVTNLGRVKEKELPYNRSIASSIGWQRRRGTIQ
ncbi:hypothetical protein HELRODRAFT_190279 [Helobdella robusta]|uniref:Uncharacterized protein n=1 Tax=Helobdella robusta TaxID=6412 RepID=T1FRU9_HELRO|nr:hypothetical protein HELRODRAFT_190279 [Helobdella robusta]ESO11027.1 hypothetical protein HELRODRAFT_190279 [Helobdella robusta]